MTQWLGLPLGPSIYVASVIGTGAVSLVWAMLWLRRNRAQRRARLVHRRWLDAVLTRTPLENPLEETRGQGMDTINRNTTVAQRALVPLIVLLTCALVSIPYLDRVPAAALSVLVGALTVFVGLAARPIVEQAFAGLVIAFSQVINIGDTVSIDEIYGTVEDITLTHTTIRSWDWRRYVIPNGRMLQNAFINHSLRDRHQWAYVEFWVGYDANIEEVEEVAISAASQSPHCADIETPCLWVMDMEERGLRCWVAAWAETPSQAWSLKCDVRRRLVTGLQARGIRSHSLRIDLQEGPEAPTEPGARGPVRVSRAPTGHS